MPDEEEKQENQQADEEYKARRRKQHRDWYQRNRHWILEQKAQERAALPKKRRKRRKKKKPPEVNLERERREKERADKLAAAQRFKDEWNDLGWVVAKMNVEAKLTQERIYTLLGGLATKQKISEWCKYGKTLRRIKPLK